MKKIYLMIAAAVVTIQANAQLKVSTFDDIAVASNSYLNGSGMPVEGKFTSGKVEFPNVYQTAYGGYWSDGWAYSDQKDDTSAGYSHLYNAYAASGNNGSANYAIGQGFSMLRLIGADAGKPVKAIYITNGTYAARSMLKGDMFAKKFGGATGNDPDYFALTIKAFSNGIMKSDSVRFYLADYRFANNTQDYIVKAWTKVDLTSLGNADSLIFTLSSSDNGSFGMNTPAFFCIDDVITNADTAGFENLNLSAGSYWNKTSIKLSSTFESGEAKFPNTYSTSSYGDYWSSGFAISSTIDTVTPGLDNLYSAARGKGYDTSSNYAVAQTNCNLIIKQPAAGARLKVHGFYVNNTTYTALSMKKGDGFAKKFGGATGNDPDYFMVTVKANNTTDSVSFYLADFLNSDNSKDYILTDWRWVDLTKLGAPDTLKFTLSSSDVGAFGMNTPAFFAMDNFTLMQSTGLNEVTHEIEATIYPNPASSLLHVDAGNHKISLLTVYDLAGKEVLQSQTSTVDVEGLNNGLYILRMITEDGIATSRFLKN